MPQGDLAVISRAKDLCGYLLQATDASPKRFRFTLVSRLQNYALDVVDRLFRANEVFVAAGAEQAGAERERMQRDAMTPEPALPARPGLTAPTSRARHEARRAEQCVADQGTRHAEAAP